MDVLAVLVQSFRNKDQLSTGQTLHFVGTADSFNHVAAR